MRHPALTQVALTHIAHIQHCHAAACHEEAIAACRLGSFGIWIAVSELKPGLPASNTAIAATSWFKPVSISSPSKPLTSLSWAAALLPYDPTADMVVLIEQFRLPALAAGLDPVLVELPAGLADAAELAQVTALRETREETGLVPDRVEPISEVMLTPGGSDEVCSLFVGRVRVPDIDKAGIAGHGGLAVEQEDIRVRVWPALEAIDAAMAGKLPNVLTMVTLLWFAARREWLRQEWART